MVNSFSSRSRSLSSELAGVAAKIGATALAVKGLETAFKGAMQMETDKLTLGALVNDAEKANKLFDMLQQKGLKSVFSDTDFMGAGKAFLPITKDLNQINSLLGITERLASSNPLQGMEGASFAIREALSGDLVSLQERFNIPRSTLKEAFKGASTATEKIAALDKVLNGLGFTQKFVNKVNTSASAQWQTLQSNVTTAMAKMGGAALEKLKKPLTDINKWIQGGGLNGLKDMGSKFLADAVSKAVEFGNYIKNNWPAIKQNFAELNTALAPVKEGLGAILSGAMALASYMASDWNNTVDIVISLAAGLVTLRASMMALAIISTITSMMNAYRTAVVGATTVQAFFNGVLFANPIGLVIAAIAALVAAGVYLYRNWDTVSAKMSAVWNVIKRAAASAVNFMISGINKLIGLINKIPGVNIPIIPKVNWGNVKGVNENASTTIARTGKTSSGHAISSHAGGLNRVPYDQYPMFAHKGEAVLTRSEADAWRKGQGKGGSAYHITVNVNGQLTDQRTVDTLLDAMVTKIQIAGLSGA
jgi:hypothetical protein